MPDTRTFSIVVVIVEKLTSVVEQSDLCPHTSVQGGSLSPPCSPGAPVPASTFYRLGAQREQDLAGGQL